MKFNITIQNDNGAEKGIQKLLLNGKEIHGSLIKLDDMLENNEVTAIMG